jgi:hypothetical protein
MSRNDAWDRIEITTDPLGDTITTCSDETGEHVILETFSNDEEGGGMPTYFGNWMPRLSAIEIVGGDDVWTFRLNDRATVLELTLLGHHYDARLQGEDAEGRMILRPGPGVKRPSREDLVRTLAQGIGRDAARF